MFRVNPRSRTEVKKIYTLHEEIAQMLELYTEVDEAARSLSSLADIELYVYADIKSSFI